MELGFSDERTGKAGGSHWEVLIVWVRDKTSHTAVVHPSGCRRNRTGIAWLAVGPCSCQSLGLAHATPIWDKDKPRNIEWQKSRACEGAMWWARDSQKEEAMWHYATNCDIPMSCFRGVLISVVLTYLLQPIRRKTSHGKTPCLVQSGTRDAR